MEPEDDAESRDDEGRRLVGMEPIDEIEPVSNDAQGLISLSDLYTVEVRIEGSAALLLQRFSTEAVEAKSKAAKGSAAKKTDDVESYVYRDENGYICMPGEYLRSAICNSNGAAKFKQDPRSPRKSALDLYKAGISLPLQLAPVITAEGTKATKWDYLDVRRAVVQRSAVTRTRPAFRAGWSASFTIEVLTPEYITPTDLLDTLNTAGRLIGIGNFRPTYGRFMITSFEVLPRI